VSTKNQAIFQVIFGRDVTAHHTTHSIPSHIVLTPDNNHPQAHCVNAHIAEVGCLVSVDCTTSS